MDKEFFEIANRLGACRLLHGTENKEELMRLLMTATELSASAETRGISYPCEKTHYILVDFRLRDSILLIGMLALFAVVIWTSFQPISTG